MNGFYDFIIDKYYLEKGKVKPDRWVNVSETINHLLSRASQNIANMFLSFEDYAQNYDAIYYQLQRHISLSKKIELNKIYHIIKYKSGSILIKNIKRKK